jgi:hypothetical protein
MVADVMYGSMRNMFSFCTSNGCPTPPLSGTKESRNPTQINDFNAMFKSLGPKLFISMIIGAQRGGYWEGPSPMVNQLGAINHH